ncbi:MAG TPA: hypothetical protein VI299_23305 [Polyangiales bacterium]
MQALNLVPKHAAGTSRAAKEPTDLDEELEAQDFSGRDVAAPRDEAKASAPREVNVDGIEGTMSEFDVRVALDGRDADFNRCHDEHRGGSGRIAFHIRVLPSGEVGDVKAHPSHVRSKGIIECYTRVVASTHFSTPHGGFADVKWTTKVGRSRKRQDPIYDRPHRYDAPASPSGSEGGSRAEARRERRHHHHHRSHKRRRRS